MSRDMRDVSPGTYVVRPDTSLSVAPPFPLARGTSGAASTFRLMSWQHGRLVAFDIETTGVRPTVDRIVTAAVAVVGGGLPSEHHDWLVDPGVEIPAGATAVHG